jgi:hypothetical protein
VRESDAPGRAASAAPVAVRQASLQPPPELGETLPSKASPSPSQKPGTALAKRGISQFSVLFLVLAALIAGVLLGWALARLPD